MRQQVIFAIKQYEWLIDMKQGCAILSAVFRWLTLKHIAMYLYFPAAFKVLLVQR